MSPATLEPDTGIQIPSLDDHLCLGIYSASLAIQRTYKPMLDAMGITYPQYLVLNLLWSEDGQTVGGLAHHLDLEPSTLTPLLKRLEASGHVTRARNPENERQVLIHVTQKGRDLRAEVGCMGATLIANSGMSLEDLAALNQQVRKLRDNLNRHLRQPPPK
ncbi:MarR family transcriptional regulator [uncultured Hyphomonas sp.]|uniref:MarR family winged helix-turn-helix transcriptional regulator n=1 Tax=uncultured Hyphomonas sp. TaxID=225298 RepID=UPI002AABDF39|nr:MarR family transcriptional regulator [uncultured Hyphomonas sp.]